MVEAATAASRNNSKHRGPFRICLCMIMGRTERYKAKAFAMTYFMSMLRGNLRKNNPPVDASDSFGEFRLILDLQKNHMRCISISSNFVQSVQYCSCQRLTLGVPEAKRLRANYNVLEGVKWAKYGQCTLGLKINYMGTVLMLWYCAVARAASVSFSRHLPAVHTYLIFAG